MTRRVITVRPDTSVGEIADLLLEHKVCAVPVIDDDRHVVGIVSEGELLGHPPSGGPRAWRRLEPEAHGPAETLLAAAREQAALLVMGGYGHSRLREWIFGGFTQRILRGAEIPVLIAH